MLSIIEINQKIQAADKQTEQLEENLIKTAVLVKGVVKSLESMEEGDDGKVNITVIMDHLYGEEFGNKIKNTEYKITNEN